VKIACIDLTHTGTVVDANYFPLGVAYIAATTKAALGDACDIRLLKYPKDLSAYLSDRRPDIAAFSNYMWNERLSLAYAAAIKQRYPNTVTVFGGPNYPVDRDEQEVWLRERPEVDFYIDGEGELPFVELVRALAAVDFRVEALKAARSGLPSLHYVADGTFCHSALAPRIADLESAVPSPYLTGLMEPFFDGTLLPLVQTTRGCPYSCAFCHDGIEYMSKTRRFSQARISAELEYIAERVNVPTLTMADLNWGIYREDVETARTLARIKAERQWPRMVSVSTAKNNTVRVAEIARLLGDSFYVGASIQSTDSVVLKNVKRANIGTDNIVAMAKAARASNTGTMTEIILGLPGDTKEKHFKSVFDMLDAEIQDVLSYQFILLPGTEGSTEAARRQFGYRSKFRVLPRCFGRYRIFDREVPIAEIHEVCVANDTLPFDDYEECRWFNLSLAIFNNGRIIQEILQLAEMFGVRRSTLMPRIHAAATRPDSPLRPLYEAFRADEARNFWPNRQALLDFLARPEGFDAYMSGDYGANQMFKYRFQAVFGQLHDVLDLAIATVRRALEARVAEDARIGLCLDQLREVIAARRSALTDIDRTFETEVNFDFVELDKAAWAEDPRTHWSPQPRRLRVAHSPDRRENLKTYFRQYGTSANGLIYFLHRNRAQVLYRDISFAS
jgi:radical SAM superfamily enzyme YgiQ (UPF0313 family)